MEMTDQEKAYLIQILKGLKFNVDAGAELELTRTIIKKIMEKNDASNDNG